MVESSCHHAIFDDGGLALGYVLPPPQPPSLAAQGSPATPPHWPPRPTGSTGWPWRKRQLRLLLVLASLWPCTEPSNRSEGLRKTRTNFGHNLLQLQRVAFHTLEAKRSTGSEPLRLGLPGPVGKLASALAKRKLFFCLKSFLLTVTS